MGKFLKYSIFSYIIIGFLFWLFVDYKKTALDHLNFFKGIETRLLEIKEQKAAANKLDWQEGIHFYRDMLAASVGSAPVRANIGYCYFNLGDYKRALNEYEEAIWSEPNLYTLHLDAALTCLALRDFSRADMYFEKARALLPVIKDYYVFLAEHFRQQKNKRGIFLLGRLVVQAESDQRKIIEKLTKGYDNKNGHNTMMSKASADDLHFLTVEEALLLGGLKYAAKR